MTVKRFTSILVIFSLILAIIPPGFSLAPPSVGIPNRDALMQYDKVVKVSGKARKPNAAPAKRRTIIADNVGATSSSSSGSGFSKNALLSAIAILFTILLITPLHLFALDVTLAWDPVIGSNITYKLFRRGEGQPYDYENPIWEGPDIIARIFGLDDSVIHYFVCRAKNDYGESDDSNEVYTQAPVSEPGTEEVIPEITEDSAEDAENEYGIGGTISDMPEETAEDSAVGSTTPDISEDANQASVSDSAEDEPIPAVPDDTRNEDTPNTGLENSEQEAPEPITAEEETTVNETAGNTAFDIPENEESTSDIAPIPADAIEPIQVNPTKETDSNAFNDNHSEIDYEEKTFPLAEEESNTPADNPAGTGCFIDTIENYSCVPSSL